MTTLEFCRLEIDKYLFDICGKKCDIDLKVSGEYNQDIFEEKSIISIKNGRGYIEGNRPRAVLLGIYEFLRQLGCAFLRPGKNGEIIPKKNISEISVTKNYVPSNRHRGITIEGAVSLENIIGIIDWSAKVGFNSYFIQFKTAYEFFRRWYTHDSNDFIEKEEFNEEKSIEFVNKIIKQIKQRDMIYHAVGHGWTAECLGIDANGWISSSQNLSEKKKSLIAEINGERALFKNIPLNTHLCYSNSVVRNMLADNVVNYLLLHPEIDVLHFWLADDYNNVCECEECSKKNFSDWYVMILNLIDSKLTANNIKAKICFLVYFDSYWKPETEKIINEDRFIMLFAPLFRTYTKSYHIEKNNINLEYKKNKINYPSEPSIYINFLNEWKTIFHGDTCDFDYHLMWDINRDFGGETLSKVIYDDVHFLSEMGLNGLLSCQIQRAFYPNGLSFYTLARTLDNKTMSFEKITKEYYNFAFGKYAEFASSIFKKLGVLAPFAFMRDEINSESAYPVLKQAVNYISNVLNNFVSDKNICETQELSLSLLKFMLQNVQKIIEELIMKIEGIEEDIIIKSEKQRMKFFNEKELEFQPYVDGFYFKMITNGIITSTKTGIFA